jgi:hypothetical protein
MLVLPASSNPYLLTPCDSPTSTPKPELANSFYQSLNTKRRRQELTRYHAISETPLNVEGESEITRNEEGHGQPDWLARVAEGLDALEEVVEKSENPCFVVAALVREVSPEDKDRQARGRKEGHVPQKSKQDPAPITIPNVSVRDSIESEGNRNVISPHGLEERLPTQSFYADNISQDIEKISPAVQDQRTFD